MIVSRRSLRKALLLVGCLAGRFAWPEAAVGLVCVVLGGALHFLSKAYLEQNRRLTTAGPYRWTRNPFYFANFLIDAGIVFLIGQLWLGLGYFVLFALAYRQTIADEEAKLRTLFGDAYQRYAAVVPRFWPTLRPYPRAEAQGRFDLRNPSLVEGREYARLLGIALAPATLWAAEAIRVFRWQLLDSAHATELGLVLAVPAVWVLKLALAETFRRPELALVPLGRPVFVAGILVSVFLLALGIHHRALWLAVWPCLVFGLWGLDRVGARRFGTRRGSGGNGVPGPVRLLWPYAGPIAVGSMLALTAVSVGVAWIRASG